MTAKKVPISLPVHDSYPLTVEELPKSNPIFGTAECVVIIRRSESNNAIVVLLVNRGRGKRVAKAAGEFSSHAIATSFAHSSHIWIADMRKHVTDTLKGKRSWERFLSKPE